MINRSCDKTYMAAAVDMSGRAGVSGQNTDSHAIKVVNGQLSYIGRDCEKIPPHLANNYGTVVRRLDLSFNRLRCLDGLEGFSDLEELILDNNELGDDIVFPTLKNLHTLTLNKNRHICNLDNLLDNILMNFPVVSYLSLLGNEACPNQLSSREKDEEDYHRYRLYVLHRAPNLKFLDSSPVKNFERTEAKRQGPFLRVIRFKEEDLFNTNTDDLGPPASPYTPLPREIHENADNTVTYSTCKYVYHGKHSEGNRFIRNNDL